MPMLAFTLLYHWCLLLLSTSAAFLLFTRINPVTSFQAGIQPQQLPTSTSTRLFVFDFFRERSQEGLDQLGSLTEKAKRGQLGQGLAEAAIYTRATNQAFADGLAKSRNRLLNQLEAIVTGTDPNEVLTELEDVLLQADIGLQTAEEIIAEVQSLRETSSKRLSKNDLKSIMRGRLLEALEINRRFPRNIQFSDAADTPTVLFIMGANGMGKTTTIGKLAHRLRTEGNQTVLLAACDTFRAGAVDQLQTWAERANVDMVRPSDTASKPSSVLYQALDKAMTQKYDTLLVDTSGRLSNNAPLTEELVKMKRIIQKRLSTANEPDLSMPHETLLVLDAAQGRMASDSAKAWDESIGITGLILTKLDGSAKGGSVVAVSRDLGLPVKLIGVGEGIEDLRDFEPESFVDGLLGIGTAGGKADTEGALLAARLSEMRQERDEQAKSFTPEPVPAEASELQVAAGSSEEARQGPMKPKRKKKKKSRK